MRIAVVGGGILGLAATRLIAERHPDAEAVVLEKEPAVAQHQTGHNSGVIHAGIYYAPGSLKARLCRRGVGLLEDFCDRSRVPYDKCGKLIVATEREELGRLADLEVRARANGVPGLQMLHGGELQEVEPHVRGIAALHSPETAVVDYAVICRALVDEIRGRGGQVEVNRPVLGVESSPDTASLHLADGRVLSADRVLVCAGLQADALARASGQPESPRIVPFRGEYWQLRPECEEMIRGLIYPVPDPGLPFLGVHLTKRVDGAVLIGPNAVLALSREGYDWSALSLSELAEMLRYPGTWKLFAQNWRVGMVELTRSLSKALFVRGARRYVPDITASDVIPAPAGVRAQAVDRDGTMVDDFRIESAGVTTWVRNAPSPAATSSLAIAEELVERMGL